MLKKGDVFLFIILFVIISGWYLVRDSIANNGDSGGKTAVVRQDGNEIRRIELDSVQEPYKFDIKGEYHLEVMVEKGKIRFLEADCPDKVCVRTGWLIHSGDTAVCIPNRTIIKIEGQAADVDGVTY